MLVRDVRIIAVVALLILSAATFHDSFHAVACPAATATGEYLTSCDQDVAANWSDLSDTSEGQETWHFGLLTPFSDPSPITAGQPRPGNGHTIDHPPAA